MIVIDSTTMAAIDRYDAMDDSRMLKRLSPAELTPQMVSTDLDIDLERAEVVLEMIRGPIDDVVSV